MKDDIPDRRRPVFGRVIVRHHKLRTITSFAILSAYVSLQVANP
jgi:hypothetical protein